MAEVLLLGTYHFMQSSDDIFTDSAQNELDLLVKRLAEFAPDAVALEAPVTSQAYIDESFAKFSLADLENKDKMQSESLGMIKLYGELYPITYDNEAVQIGYRLAKVCAHARIHAIDDDSILDMNALKNPSEAYKSALSALDAYEKHYGYRTLTDQLRCLNSDAWSRLNHDIYMQANSLGSDYEGAEMVAKWYARNLKIFCNIQRLAERYARIFVLFGAGHVQILRELINADSALTLVDIEKYL